jgi:hypothetical protein
MTTVPYTFGNESSPIPLSQLDANFAVTPNYANSAGNVVNAVQANITSVGTLTALSVGGNVDSGNLRTTGAVSATGNIATNGRVSATGNITGSAFVTTGTVSATGNITGSAFVTTGTVSATGNITGNYIIGNGRQLSGMPVAYTNANLATLGSNVISTTGTITGGNITGSNLSVGGNVAATGQISSQGNVLAQGIVSAVGNIVTAANFVGNFLGNITGNLSVGGSNTQVLFNRNGNVGAAGGLTYNSGSNTLGVLGVVSAQGNIYGANLILSGTGNLNLGGNLTVADNLYIGGTGNLNLGGNLTVADDLNIGGNLVVPGTTQLVGVATAPTAPTGTANNQVASTAFVNNQINQYANNVAITGGNITAENISATTARISNWTIKQISNTLYFQFGGSNVAKLDSSGNFTTIGNVTGFGTI